MKKSARWAFGLLLGWACMGSAGSARAAKVSGSLEQYAVTYGPCGTLKMVRAKYSFDGTLIMSTAYWERVDETTAKDCMKAGLDQFRFRVVRGSSSAYIHTGPAWVNSGSDASWDIPASKGRNQIFCDRDNRNCLSDDEALVWMKEGFSVEGFEIYGREDRTPPPPPAPPPPPKPPAEAPRPKPSETPTAGGGAPEPAPGAAAKSKGGDQVAGGAGGAPRGQAVKPGSPPDGSSGPDRRDEGAATEDDGRDAAEEDGGSGGGRTVVVPDAPPLQTLDDTIVNKTNPWEDALKAQIGRDFDSSRRASAGSSLPSSGFPAYLISGTLGQRFGGGRIDTIGFGDVLVYGFGASVFDSFETSQLTVEETDESESLDGGKQRIEARAGAGGAMHARLGFSLIHPWHDFTPVRTRSTIALGIEGLFGIASRYPQELREDIALVTAIGPEIVVLYEIKRSGFGFSGNFGYRFGPSGGDMLDVSGFWGGVGVTFFGETGDVLRKQANNGGLP